MELLQKTAKIFGINLSKEQLEKFEIYMNYLLEYNSHTNLTAIKNPEDIIIKHFLDSIIITNYLSEYLQLYFFSKFEIILLIMRYH